MGGLLSLLVFHYRPDITLRVLSGSWDYTNQVSRDWIQNALDCCGFKSITDRPSNPCPYSTPCLVAMQGFETAASIGWYTSVSLMVLFFSFFLIF